MANVDISTARALSKLRAPELAPFISWLQGVHQKAAGDCAAVADVDTWRKLQGRAALAKELLDLVASADEIAAKIEGRPQHLL